LPTIRYLLKNNCKIYLVSHLGRPKGLRDKKLSLKPVAEHLQKILGQKVNFYEKDLTTGYGIRELDKFKLGEVILLENIRFYKQEKDNESQFSKTLAQIADIFVNDAFGVSHRAHASTVGITEFLPAVAGLLLEKEVDIIGRAIDKPKRPMVAVIGGAKAEDKITLVGKLLEKADYCLIGGGTANTFLNAWGYKVGKSKVYHEMVELAKKLFWKASRRNTAMLLPTDVVLGNLETGKVDGVVSVDHISSKWQALDIGPKTQAEFGNIIAKSQTIIWNGPMGVFEKKEFRNGTDFIYYSIAQNPDSLSIVGGGDTITALAKKEYLKIIDHVSTGGGAMLEFIEKGSLPGIQVLEDK
jgi:phosphoglycerate kinase